MEIDLDVATSRDGTSVTSPRPILSFGGWPVLAGDLSGRHENGSVQNFVCEPSSVIV